MSYMRSKIITYLNAYLNATPKWLFYKFAPGETVFMAGEVYCIKPDGPFESIVLDENNSFRSYKKLRAEKQVLYAARNKERRKYDQKVYVAKLPSFLDKGKILSIAYDPACRISFINYGCLRHKKTEPFEDAEGSTFKFGYSIIRQAVLLRFDPAVGAEPQMVLQFGFSYWSSHQRFLSLGRERYQNTGRYSSVVGKN